MFLPRLYAILDVEILCQKRLDILKTAMQLRDAGLEIIQYRDKRSDEVTMLRDATRLAYCLDGTGCRLIMNDHFTMVEQVGFDGVHLGQDDGDVCVVRKLLPESALIGLSTHNERQLRVAIGLPVDYVAIGPVFATRTKADASPVIGLDGVRYAKALSNKPLVAIGGIGADAIASVLDAGADSVAVISALYHDGRSVEQNARELLKAAESAGNHTSFR